MDWSPISKADVTINKKAYALARTADSMGYRRIRERVDDLPTELTREFKTGHGGGGVGHDLDLDTYAWADGMVLVEPFQARVALPETQLDSIPCPFTASTPNKHWAVENGTRIQRWNPVTGTKEHTTTVGGAAHTAAVAFNDKLFVASGTTADLRSLSETSGETVYTDIKREFLVVGRDKLWGSVPNSHQIYSLRSVDDPAIVGNAGWRGPFPVGDPGGKITGLYTLDRFTMVTKTDGVYAVDDNGDFRVILPELREVLSQYNGRQGAAWFGGLLTPQEYGLLYFEEGIDPIQIGPEVIPYNNTPLRGTPVAVAAAGKYLYCLIITDNEAGEAVDVWLMFGRLPEQTDSPTGEIVWHPIHRSTVTLGATVPDKRFGIVWKRFRVSADESPYHILYTTPGGQFRYQTDPLGLPLGTHVQTNGATPAGTLYTSGVDFKTPRDKKLRKVEIEADSEIALTVSVSTDVDDNGWDAATWFTFGTKRGPHAVFEHPDYLHSTKGSGRVIWLKIEAVQDAVAGFPANPLRSFGPRIYTLRLFAEPQVEVMQYLELDLMLAKDVMNARGVAIGRSPRAQLDELYKLIDSTDSGDTAIEIRDPTGARWHGRVVDLQEQGIVSVPSVGPAVVATVRIQLVKQVNSAT